MDQPNSRTSIGNAPATAADDGKGRVTPTAQSVQGAFSAALDPIADALSDQRAMQNIAQRFWRYVDKSGGPDSCWPWLGAVRKGYGNFKLKSYTNVRSHRMAYALAHGESPGDLHVCHQCDNPPCCNDRHLFLGTNAENHADKVAKGRNRTGDRRGEKNGYAKLTADQVAIVRTLILDGLTNKTIAARFGVTHQAISRIRRGRSWGEPAMQPKYASLKQPRAA
jgi:hypothetical protein